MATTSATTSPSRSPAVHPSDPRSAPLRTGKSWSGIPDCEKRWGAPTVPANRPLWLDCAARTRRIGSIELAPRGPGPLRTAGTLLASRQCHGGIGCASAHRPCPAARASASRLPSVAAVEDLRNHHAQPSRTSSRLRLRPSRGRHLGQPAPLVIAHSRDPSRDELSQGLLGLIAECLAIPWGVDSSQPDRPRAPHGELGAYRHP
jgi:hypothetical protein